MNCFYKINDWYSYLQTNFKAQDETAGGHPFSSAPENSVAWYTLAGYITKNLAVDPESRANYKELAKFARYKTNVDDARDRNNISIVEELYQKDNWDNFIAKIHEIAKAGFAERRASVLSINKYFFYWLYHDSEAEISIRDVKNYADDENNFFAFVKMKGMGWSGVGGKSSKKKMPDIETMNKTVQTLLSKRNGVLTKELDDIKNSTGVYKTIADIKDIKIHISNLKIPDIIEINLSNKGNKEIDYPVYKNAVDIIKNESDAKKFIANFSKYLFNDYKIQLGKKLQWYNPDRTTVLDSIASLYDKISSDANINPIEKKIKDIIKEYETDIKSASADKTRVLTNFKKSLKDNMLKEYEIDGITWFFHKYFFKDTDNINEIKAKLQRSYDNKLTPELTKIYDELKSKLKPEPPVVDGITGTIEDDTIEEVEEDNKEAEDIPPPIITPPKPILSDNDKSFISKISELAMTILEKFNNNSDEELIKEYGHLHQLIKNYINELRGNILDTKKPDKTIYLKKLSSNIGNEDLEHIYTQLSLKLWPNEAEPGTLVRDLIEYCIDNDPVITLIASVNEFYYNFESKKGMLVWSRPNRSVGSHHADFFSNVLILKSETVKGVGKFDINESDYTPFLGMFANNIGSIKIKTGITKIIQKGAGMRWNGVGGFIGGSGVAGGVGDVAGAGVGAVIPGVGDEDLTEMTIADFINIYADYFKDIEHNSSVLVYQLYQLLQVLQKNYYVKEYAKGVQLLRRLFKKHKTLPIIFNADNATDEQKLRLSTMMNAGIPDNYCIRKKTIVVDAMEYLHLSKIKKKTQEWEDYGLLNYLIGTEKYDIVKISSEFEMRKYDSILIAKYYFQYMDAIIRKNITLKNEIIKHLPEFECFGKTFNEFIKEEYFNGFDAVMTNVVTGYNSNIDADNALAMAPGATHDPKDIITQNSTLLNNTYDSAEYKKIIDLFKIIETILPIISSEIKIKFNNAKDTFQSIPAINAIITRASITDFSKKLEVYAPDDKIIPIIATIFDDLNKTTNKRNEVHNLKHEIIFKKLANDFYAIDITNDIVDIKLTNFAIITNNNPNDIIKEYYDDVYCEKNDGAYDIIYRVIIKDLSISEEIPATPAPIPAPAIIPATPFAAVTQTTTTCDKFFADKEANEKKIEDAATQEKTDKQTNVNASKTIKELRNPVSKIEISEDKFEFYINTLLVDFAPSIAQIKLHPGIEATKIFYVLHKFSELYKIRFIVIQTKDNIEINRCIITPAFFSNAGNNVICKSTIYLNYVVMTGKMRYIKFCTSGNDCRYRNEILYPEPHGLFRHEIYNNDMYNLHVPLMYNNAQKEWIRANLGKFISMGTGLYLSKSRDQHLSMLRSLLSKINELLGINYILHVQNPKFVETFFEIILTRLATGYADYFAIFPELKMHLYKIAQLVPHMGSFSLENKTLYQLFCIIFNILGIIPNMSGIRLKEDLSLYLSDYSKTKIDQAKELSRVLSMKPTELEYEEFYDDQYSPKYLNSVSRKLKLLLGDKYPEEDMDIMFSGDYRSKVQTFFISASGNEHIQNVQSINNFMLYPRHGQAIVAPWWYKVQLATELVMLELFDYTTYWPYTDLLSYYEKYIFTRYESVDLDKIMKTAIINADWFVCYDIITSTKLELSADFLPEYFRLVELCYNNYSRDDVGTDEWRVYLANQFIRE